MIESLLVPLDGSEVGERALPYARALAQATGARVLLVRVVWEDPAQGDARSDAQAYLQQVAEELGRSGVIPQVEILEGDAAEAISLEARRRGADLIVMTTHGRTGVGRWLYGSVAEGVLARARSPVMLVRGWTDESMAPTEVATILVPLDGTDFAEAALPLAREIARMLPAKLVLFRVASARAQQGAVLTETAPDTFRYSEAPEEVARLEAESYLQRIASDCGRHGVDAEVDVALGDPGREICRAERGHGAGLVVMTTHARTGLERLVLGSVATEVLRCGAAPLVLLARRP